MLSFRGLYSLKGLPLVLIKMSARFSILTIAKGLSSIMEIISFKDILLLIWADSIQGWETISFCAVDKLTWKMFLLESIFASLRISFLEVCFIPEISMVLIFKKFDQLNPCKFISRKLDVII